METAMRSMEDKDYIASNLIDPFSIEGFLTIEEINGLIEIFNSTSNPVIKNTNTIALSVKFYDQNSPQLLKLVLDKIKDALGDCEVFDALFFKAVYPHIVHNDDNYDFPLLYRAVTLPLEITYNDSREEIPSLCFFDQYYLDGPAKFFNGHTDRIESFYNKPVYEYSNVLNKQNTGVSKEDISKYFTHLDPKWLDGLTIKSVLPWIPGNAIVFDCARLHAASDFRQLGVKSKLGLSIFTRKKKT